MKMSALELSLLKEYLKARIAYARYLSGFVWHRIEIYNVKVLEDGRLAVYLMFGSDAPDKIERIEFYNADGGLFSSGDVQIDKAAFPDGILFRYTIGIQQEQDND